MSLEEIRVGTQGAWDQLLQLAQRLGALARRSSRLKARLAFVLVSKLYRQMYANTGIATDSARVPRSTRWARWLGLAARRLFLDQADAAAAGSRADDGDTAVVRVVSTNESYRPGHCSV